ncbi:transposase [Streptomyces sp. TRM76323]|uniref:Transposase n=1 Tax=Streptomyces tamarix TaxID=3078565 RepID=A0ABU3QIX3_9ACTN|nr:transposase [Streptomyces tamarix]MDT9682369.1 transposase [Streptomyces tamarix]
MKHYPPQFEVDAVAPYQSRPEVTIRQVAADLGVNPEALRNWVRAAGAGRPRGRRAETSAEPPTPLGAENAALREKIGGVRTGVCSGEPTGTDACANGPFTRAARAGRRADSRPWSAAVLSGLL